LASVLFSVGYGIKWGVTQRCRGGPLSEPRRQKLGLDGLPLVRDHEAARSDGGAHHRSPLRAGGLQSQDARSALSVVGSLAVPVAKAVCDAPTMPRSHDPRHRSTQKNTEVRRKTAQFRLFECIRAEMEKGSPERYNFNAGLAEPAQKGQTGEPNDHQSLYRIRCTQEKRQLLREDRRRADRRRRQAAGDRWHCCAASAGWAR